MIADVLTFAYFVQRFQHDEKFSGKAGSSQAIVGVTPTWGQRGNGWRLVLCREEDRLPQHYPFE